MLTEGGRWFVLARFSQPLDADRLYDMLVAAGARRPLRLHRYLLLGEYDPREEA